MAATRAGVVVVVVIVLLVSTRLLLWLVNEPGGLVIIRIGRGFLFMETTVLIVAVFVVSRNNSNDLVGMRCKL